MYLNTRIDPVPTDLRILNKYEQLESFSAFNSVYNNSGLFGIYAVTVSLSQSSLYCVHRSKIQQSSELTGFFLLLIIIQQSPDFSSKAVDLAAGELLEIATPGKGSSLSLVSVRTYFRIGLSIISHISFVLCLLPLSFTRTA
jgi:hypothetical protein